MPNNKNIVATTAAGGASGLQLVWFGASDLTPPVAAAGTAGVQVATVTGTPTGGTFTLTYGGQTTGTIAYNAATSAVQTALQALSSIGTGNATVAGSAGGPYTVTLNAYLVPSTLALGTNALTGGSTPSVTFSTTTPGVQTTRMGTATVPAGFKDPGMVDASGVTKKLNPTFNEVLATGSLYVQRAIPASFKAEFDFVLLEHTHTAVEVYHGQALGSTGVADALGGFAVTVGPPQITLYSMLIDIVDGLNHIRWYLPRVQNTNPGDQVFAAGKEIQLPVNMTAYPDNSGNVAYGDIIVNALAGL